MLFPIILAVLVVPFACLCMPCFLRLIVRFRATETQNQNRGASRAAINSLPTVKYKCVSCPPPPSRRSLWGRCTLPISLFPSSSLVRTIRLCDRPNMFGEEEGSAVCPICLGDYTDNETLRVLRCSGAHHFHIA